MNSLLLSRLGGKKSNGPTSSQVLGEAALRPSGEGGEPRRITTAALLGASAALASATLLRLPAAWATGNALNHVSGSWLALAVDLAHGTFYRPFIDPSIGVGGTRFFPLLFTLHAALISWGADVLASAYLLSLLGAIAVGLGVYALIRNSGQNPAESAAFAVLAFAGVAAQEAITASRGDLLPVGLCALGLASVARRGRGSGLWLGAAAFVLAFAAKPTALTAPLGALVFLLQRGERRAALRLLSAVLGGVVLVLLVTDHFSQGRFFALLSACASGGATPFDLLRGPVRLVRGIADDKVAALVVVSALFISLRGLWGYRGKDPGPHLLACLWLLVALGAAALVLASPGTDSNHLVETEAAGAAVLGTCVRRGRVSAWVRTVAPVCAVSGFVVALSFMSRDSRSSRLAEIHDVLADLPAGTVFSEDPLIPIVASDRPYVLDPFMLRVTSEHDPALASRLRTRILEGNFGSVVLYGDLSDPSEADWYTGVHFGPSVAAAIRNRYQPSVRHGRYLIYLPNTQVHEATGSVTTSAQR